MHTPRFVRHLFSTSVAASAAALMTTAVVVAPQADARRGPEGPVGPPAADFVTAYARSLLQPGLMPPEVNDWNCRPSPEHPRPVVLIHGTWDNAYATWSMLTPMLKREGYCAYALNYGDDESGWVGLPPGVYGTQTLRRSGDEVAAFVDEVIARTGRRQVDLVGHSQGGIQARLVVQDHGGAVPGHPELNTVRKVVGLGANNHGTTFAGLAALGGMLDVWRASIRNEEAEAVANAVMAGGHGQNWRAKVRVATSDESPATSWKRSLGVGLAIFSMLAPHLWPTRTPPWRTVAWAFLLSLTVGANLLLLNAGRYALMAATLVGFGVVILRINQNGRELWKMFKTWRAVR